MELKSLAVAAAFWSFGAITASAAAYKCELKSFSLHGGVPEVMYVWIGTDEGAAGVFDPIIASVQAEPAPARLRQMSANKYELTWSVEDVPMAGNHKLSFQFTARFNLASGRISLVSYVGGFANENKGEGKCEAYTG